ncbi:MAG: transcription termination factor Rho [Deltaproteobacteria bacterium]|nr:transcription termination factor Rho [Deltaproteobacteria bacterium]
MKTSKNSWRNTTRQRSQKNDRPSVTPARRSNAYHQFLQKTSIDPYERLRLTVKGGTLSMRVLDLVAPIGKGQRGLIVAPPKTGKTTFLKEICKAVALNNPEVMTYCLLIDERPEEVTDFKRSVPAEVVASSSDNNTEHHIQTANDLLEKVIVEVNEEKDVLIVVDSLTRLARVHNRDANSGKTLSGGIDSNALEVPRRFFGAARKLEEGGSLTIIATALIDTGSRMDDYIFQEFKGTGNMELVLSRKLAEERVFPAIDIAASGTRKEEKLLTEEEYRTILKMRSDLSKYNPVDAMKRMRDILE